MSIHETLLNAQKILSAAHIDSYHLDTEVLLASILKKDRSFIFAHQKKTVSKKNLETYRRLIFLRKKRMPIAYLLGKKEFYGKPFFVDKSCLIPRPETELLIDEALEIVHGNFPSKIRVLDVGTGSGCIALTLSSLAKKNTLEIEACDISSTTVTLAKKNHLLFKKNNLLNNEVKFFNSNLLSNATGTYDLIIANLPYLSKKDFDQSVRMYPELRFEPRCALVSPDFGLSAIKRLCKNAKKNLSPDGYLVCEIGHTQKRKIVSYLSKEYPHGSFHIKKDYSRKNRILIAHNFFS